MALATLDQNRDQIASTIRDTQISSLLTDFINLSLAEIHSYHTWTWLRRKTTFDTVASQENYNLDEEVGEIALLRQRSTPVKLIQVPDEFFYKVLPNIEDLSTDTPRFYRLWEESGFSTNITTAETITVVSSSASDTSSFSVRVTGRDANGLIIQETITLNGLTGVASSTTFQANGLISIAKSAATTGTITVTGTTSTTTMVRIAPTQIAPRFKRISLYPIPNAAITLYLEYYEAFRELINDNDIPQMDVKWWWVAREGALAKAWEYKQNEAATQLHQQNFLRGLEMMRRQDNRKMDLIKALEPRNYTYLDRANVKRYSDSVNDAFPSYGVGY
jgi:hypothetical protein